MSRFTVNKAGVEALTSDRNGPVVLHLANLGREIEGQARRKVGVRSGALKATIRSELVKRSDGYRVHVTAGSSSVPYSDWHHDGTRPHVITPKRGKFLVFKGRGGQTIYARKVQHPGTKANPFLRDAATAVGLKVRRVNERRS